MVLRSAVMRSGVALSRSITADSTFRAAPCASAGDFLRDIFASLSCLYAKSASGNFTDIDLK
jgi:hypothetical protein